MCPSGAGRIGPRWAIIDERRGVVSDRINSALPLQPNLAGDMCAKIHKHTVGLGGGGADPKGLGWIRTLFMVQGWTPPLDPPDSAPRFLTLGSTPGSAGEAIDGEDSAPPPTPILAQLSLSAPTWVPSPHPRTLTLGPHPLAPPLDPLLRLLTERSTGASLQ